MSPRPSPSLVSWELTRSCDQACLHCRVRGGEPAPDELRLDEALDVADQLVAMRVGRVLLSGGEPTRFAGWQAVARRLAAGGVRVHLATGGLWLDARGLADAQAAGVQGFALSLDGPPAVHDRLRPRREGAGSPGEAALRALQRLINAGVETVVMTAVSRLNLRSLEETWRLLRGLGARRWQLSQVTARGRGRDNLPLLALEPAEVEIVVALLLRVAREGQIQAPLHCSFGYMTAEEAVLRERTLPGARFWRGADAGLKRLHIHAEGGVNGCPCLPERFAVASLRGRPLAEIWADDQYFPYARAWDPAVLAGACAACPFAQLCRAGCPGVAFTSTGTIGANPTCLRASRRGAL